MPISFDDPMTAPAPVETPIPTPTLVPTPAPAPSGDTPPPAGDTPPPAEAPAGTGIAGLMDQLDRASAPPKPAAKPGDAPPAAKPGDKPPVTPPAATPPATPPKDEEPDWTKAPPKWHKIYEGHKQKTAQQIQSLESKIKQLETKPFEQAGDAARLKAMEQQLEQLKGESTTAKQELARLDFRRSDEYKQRFVVFEDHPGHGRGAGAEYCAVCGGLVGRKLVQLCCDLFDFFKTLTEQFRCFGIVGVFAEPFPVLGICLRGKPACD